MLWASVLAATLPVQAQTEPYKLIGPLTTRTAAGPEWAKDQAIYEVNLDSYGFASGTAFRSFEDHLPVLKEMGVGIIWLMPIYPRGEKKATGSPYGVRDYQDVNPNFGAKADFAHLVQKAHQLGLYIILDWVPNHTAWDNAMIDAHPEFYKRNAKGEIQQAGPWPDVAQLDYGANGQWNTPLWNQMRDNMTHWINEYDIDGFRCDVAANVPVEFWNWVRPQLNVTKPVFLLAEADTPQLHPAFDMSYSWDLPPVLWKIVAGTKPATALDTMLRKEADAYPAGSIKMRFLDNHDLHNDPNQFGGEPKLEGDNISVLDRYKGGIEPLMVLCATLPGKPMLYNGQEMSNVKALPPAQADLRRQSPVWPFYKHLFALYHELPSVQSGGFAKIVSNKDDKIYAFTRDRARERVLVVLNLTDQPQKVTLKDDKLAGSYRDWFADTDVELEASPKFELGAWGYKVLVDAAG